MRFVDEAIITVRSGKGGHGCASFRREKYIPRGGPDGGDGGRGGDVILRASERLMTLYDFRLKRLYEARNGQPGMGKARYGKAAEDRIVELPVGTLVYEIIENEQGEQAERLVADLLEDGQEVRICKGGDGGRGNIHFKTSTNRAPRRSEEGFPGEEKRLRLELKYLADVGLLGLPNAGKSTFISTISAARPKIAAYPFTTLVPNLGVIEDEIGRRMVIADIPGLIEGASEGMGLGHTFLKHVERTRFLVHLLSCEDVSRGESEDPFAGFAMIDEELARFDPAMAQKKQIRVISKIDLLDEEQLANLRQQAEEAGLDLHFISSQRGDGVEELQELLWNRLLEMAEAAAEAAKAAAQAEGGQELPNALDEPETPEASDASDVLDEPAEKL
ncbi:MAG: GTPase ObgE [Desulfovibrionaceae bacterium]